MRILRVGRANKAGAGDGGRGKVARSARGITLMEMLVVCCIIGVIVGVSVPSISAGIDSVRISTSADSVASFLNAAVNRAERRQVPVEVVITPKEGLLQVFSTQAGTQREMRLPNGVTIEAVLPEG